MDRSDGAKYPGWAEALVESTREATCLLGPGATFALSSAAAAPLLAKTPAQPTSPARLLEILEPPVPTALWNVLRQGEGRWSGTLSLRRVGVPGRLIGLSATRDEAFPWLATFDLGRPPALLGGLAFEPGLWPLVLHDSEGRIRCVNRCFLELLGREESEVLGTFAAKLHPPSGPYAPPQFRLEVGETFRFRTRLLRGAGDELPVEVQVIKIREGSEELILGSLTDLSREEQLLAKLHRFQRMELLSRLSGGIAHDLNNSLMVSLAGVELLANSNAGSGTALEDIMKASRSAADLTAWLKGLATSDSGRREPTNLNRLLADLQQVLDGAVGSEIGIVFEFADILPDILTDPSQMIQMVANLVWSARDAMPGGGTVTIRTGVRWRKEDEFVVLSFEDTGSPTAILGRSEQLQAWVRGQEDAIDVALSAVQSIVASHSGFLEVSTDTGSTFVSVWLPVAAVPEEPKVFPFPVGSSHHDYRVLVVDDMSAVRKIVRRILERGGFVVDDAADGQAALERIRAQELPPIDLVVTDLLMPHINGSELCDRLADEKPELPVIVLSAHHSDLVLENGLAPRAILSKPVRPRDLVPLVRSLIERTSVSAS